MTKPRRNIKFNHKSNVHSPSIDGRKVSFSEIDENDNIEGSISDGSSLKVRSLSSI
jgi:hypothetical protein